MTLMRMKSSPSVEELLGQFFVVFQDLSWMLQIKLKSSWSSDAQKHHIPIEYGAYNENYVSQSSYHGKSRYEPIHKCSFYKFILYKCNFNKFIFYKCSFYKFIFYKCSFYKFP